MIVKLLTEKHLEFLSIRGGCTGSSESACVKMPLCWKSHATAQMSSAVNLGLQIIHTNIKLYLTSRRCNTIINYLL